MPSCFGPHHLLVSIGSRWSGRRTEIPAPRESRPLCRTIIDFKARSRTFEDLAAMMASEVNLTPEHGDPVRLPILNITVDALPVLGLQPIAGRTFTADEDRPGGTVVVLISEQLWERSFHRRPNVVGQTLRLDDRPYDDRRRHARRAPTSACCRFCPRPHTRAGLPIGA